jgi:hypothetical protein
MSIHLSTVRPSIHPITHPPIHLSIQSAIFLSIHPFVYLSIYLSIHLFSHPSPESLELLVKSWSHAVCTVILGTLLFTFQVFDNLEWSKITRRERLQWPFLDYSLMLWKHAYVSFRSTIFKTIIDLFLMLRYIQIGSRGLWGWIITLSPKEPTEYDAPFHPRVSFWNVVFSILVSDYWMMYEVKNSHCEFYILSLTLQKFDIFTKTQKMPQISSTLRGTRNPMWKHCDTICAAYSSGFYFCASHVVIPLPFFIQT